MNRSVLCVARVTAELMKFRTISTICRSVTILSCQDFRRVELVRPICFLISTSSRIPFSRIRRSSNNNKRLLARHSKIPLLCLADRELAQDFRSFILLLNWWKIFSMSHLCLYSNASLIGRQGEVRGEIGIGDSVFEIGIDNAPQNDSVGGELCERFLGVRS